MIPPIEHSEELRPCYLVPAALLYTSHGGQGIYVKWKGHGRCGCEIISASGTNMHLMLPDREILIVIDLNQLNGTISLGGWDEFVPLSLYHENSELYPNPATGPKYFMVNAHSAMITGKGMSRMHHTRTGSHAKHHRQIIGDSGGFQLRTLADAFIDPFTVAKFYNDNVDMGMALDFPLWDDTNRENLMGAAEIQRRNTELMLPRLQPGVRLLSVAHGATPEDRLATLDVLHRPEIDALAFTNANIKTGVVQWIWNMISFWQGVERKYPGHYKHMHVLSLSENRLYVPLMRAQALGLLGDITITMDSTTHLQMGSTLTYFHHAHGTHNYAALPIGDDFNLPNPAQKLACNCPVCVAIGWQDAFIIIGTKSAPCFTLTAHSIQAMDQYFQTARWYSHHLSAADLQTWAGSVFRGKKSMVQELKSALQFVEAVRDVGMEAASKQFAFFVGMDRQAHATMTGAVDTFLGAVVDSTEFEGVDPTLIAELQEKPHAIVDWERIETYNARLEGTMAAYDYKRDNIRTAPVNTEAKRPVRKTKKKKKIPPLPCNHERIDPAIPCIECAALLLVPPVEEDDGKPKVKPKRSSGKRKLIEGKRVKKKVNNLKVTHGASLKRVKRESRKRKRYDKALGGRTVVKSKNYKRV